MIYVAPFAFDTKAAQREGLAHAYRMVMEWDPARLTSADVTAWNMFYNTVMDTPTGEEILAAEAATPPE